MKRIYKIMMVFALVFSIALLAGCSTKYKEQAGTYELYYANGDIKVSNFEYYRITLKANGKGTVESKVHATGVEYKASMTFDIEGETIKFYTKSGSQTVTEEYDYINGEIQMNNVSISGISFTAWFKR